MKRFVTGRSEAGILCVVAMALSFSTLAISPDASAKGRTDRAERGPKAWGKFKKTRDDSEPTTTESTTTESTSSEPANSAPTLSGTPAATVLENTFYDFAPVASDPDGDALTFTIANKPAWADFDPTTGALYGTPEAADSGLYDSIEISVSDGQATAALPRFAIDVTAIALGSVTLNWQPPTENTDGTPLTDLAGYRIYYGIDPQDTSNVIELSNPSLTTYVVDNLTPDTWYFVATSLNSSGVESPPSSPVSRDIY